MFVLLFNMTPTTAPTLVVKTSLKPPRSLPNTVFIFEDGQMAIKWRRLVVKYQCPFFESIYLCKQVSVLLSSIP